MAWQANVAITITIWRVRLPLLLSSHLKIRNKILQLFSKKSTFIVLSFFLQINLTSRCRCDQWARILSKGPVWSGVPTHKWVGKPDNKRNNTLLITFINSFEWRSGWFVEQIPFSLWDILVSLWLCDEWDQRDERADYSFKRKRGVKDNIVWTIVHTHTHMERKSHLWKTVGGNLAPMMICPAVIDAWYVIFKQEHQRWRYSTVILSVWKDFNKEKRKNKGIRFNYWNGGGLLSTCFFYIGFRIFGAPH